MYPALRRDERQANLRISTCPSRSDRVRLVAMSTKPINSVFAFPERAAIFSQTFREPDPDRTMSDASIS